MEFFNEDTMIERDISPAQLGRQNVTEDHENNRGDCTASCPWSSGCTGGWGLSQHPLAMVYAPCQEFHSLYDMDTALSRGTLFSELDLPLEVVEGKRTVSLCDSCKRSANKHLR